MTRTLTLLWFEAKAGFAFAQFQGLSSKFSLSGCSYNDTEEDT